MEGEINENMVLDCAVFHISQSENSYEALVCSKGKTEKLVTGPLGQLVLHLREASISSDNTFKLQVVESLEDSSWFTKFTVAMFLHMINMPDVIKVISEIMNEMSQLEETRSFHLALCAKDHQNHSEGGTSECMNEVGPQQKINVEAALSDSTNVRNELLHAMDVRLLTLKEELGNYFNQAAGGRCSTKQISDLAEFAQHFGAITLRQCLPKCLAMIPKDQPSDLSIDQSALPHDAQNNSETKAKEIQSPKFDTVQLLAIGISPAKIAQAERQSLTGSDESSESSDEDRSNIERSRPFRRSATLRRSASPMRGIQLGRSGSRRSASLTIKSLNCHPSREKPTYRRPDNGPNSGDEEPDKPPKKQESGVRMMSVQDAISLFESKQKDQNPDSQRTKISAEVTINTNKSVLRRWSAGMNDSFTNSSGSEAGSHMTSKNLNLESEETRLTEIKTEPEPLEGILNPGESAQASSPPVGATVASIDSPDELVISEINDRTKDSAEWSRQKESELNLMLTKMTECKPGKYRGDNAGSGEQRGGFYSQYKEKRDEKLRAENARTRAVKEAQFKVMAETLEQSKAQILSKTRGNTAKQDPRPRRNSSSPVLPRKEVPKPTGRRSSPGTRSLASSGPLAKTTGTPLAKPSPGSSSSITPTSNRRKPQTTPSPTKPIPSIDRAVQQQTRKNGTRIDVKPNLKGQDEKQQNAPKKACRSTKAKSPTALGADSGVKSAKPSFYSKVTKKGSVVPLESKPFLRKGTGIGPGVGPVVAKSKAPQPSTPSENNGNLVQGEETDESANVSAESPIVQTKDDVDSIIHAAMGSELNNETTRNPDQCSDVMNIGGFNNLIEFHVDEIQPDEDLEISSAAWVEIDRHEVPEASGNGLVGNAAASSGVAPSLRVRHSLSQMLQADNSELDMIEWGNAENPPALIYQKDSPKGLKRLLKFARKGKSDANSIGWSSPSVFSEGEDDAEDHILATTTSTKGTRSFFSLSTFRSSKPSETKLR